jgi:hypothetical protein
MSEGISPNQPAHRRDAPTGIDVSTGTSVTEGQGKE